MKKSTLILFLAGATCFGQAQTAPTWVSTAAVSNFQNHDAEDVETAVDSLNNIYTSASISDTVNNQSKVMLVKYNPSGAQQWIRFYDSSSPFNGSYATALVVDKAGNSYVCGYGAHGGNTSKDFLVVKFNNAGVQQWVQYWDGGQGEADFITCAALDAAGNLITAGYSNAQGTTWDDLAVVKWSPSGTMVWNYQYNNSPANGEDRALAVCTNTNNEIFVTGSSYGSNARDMVTIKVTSAGASQWVNRAPRGNSSDDQRGFGIVADGSGNSYVTGSTDNWTTFKYGTNGSTVWTSVYSGAAFNLYNVKKLALDKGANNLIVAGDAGFSGTGTDLVVSKLNASTGFSFWSVSKNNAGSDDFKNVVMDTLGYAYVSGYFDGPLGRDMCVMAISPGGNILWNTTYSNNTYAQGGDMPYAMAVDWNRDVILAGVSETRSQEGDLAYDVVTLKYSNLAVGIKVRNMETAYMRIYPNPCKDRLTLDINDRDLIGSVVSITSVTGQVIRTEKLSSFSTEINLGQMAKGMYFVSISNNNSTATQKIVID